MDLTLGPYCKRGGGVRREGLPSLGTVWLIILGRYIKSHLHSTLMGTSAKVFSPKSKNKIFPLMSTYMYDDNMSPKSAQALPNPSQKHALDMVSVRIGPRCVASTANELGLCCHRWDIFEYSIFKSGIPPAAGSVRAADIAKAGSQVQLYPAAMSGIPLNAVSYCCDSVGGSSHHTKII